MKLSNIHIEVAKEAARQIPRYAPIPAHIFDALYDYVERGIPPGNFLAAVLCNNLFDAVRLGHDSESRCLVELVNFIHFHVPHVCYQTDGKPCPEALARWIAWRQTGEQEAVLELQAQP